LKSPILLIDLYGLSILLFILLFIFFLWLFCDGDDEGLVHLLKVPFAYIMEVDAADAWLVDY
jgi:hypothetical protein